MIADNNPTGWGPLNQNLIKLDRPVLIAEKPISFGFEAEYNNVNPLTGSPHYLLATRAGSSMVLNANTAKFPFLYPYGNVEDTGNWEVKSEPYDNFAKCIEHMQLVKNALRYDPNDKSKHLLKSFHLHMRFPKSVSAESEKNFKGWISRIGDVIIFWRLQTRNLEYTLDNETQQRNFVYNLEERGPVRLQDFGNEWDLELRGFMSSNAKIFQLTSIICSALYYKSFRGFEEFQEISTDIYRQESLDSFIRTINPSHTLSPALLRELELETFYYFGEPTGRMNVVLYGYENAPFFNDIEKASIRHFNYKFVENLTRKLARNDVSTRHSYFEALRDWARSLQMHHMLMVTLWDKLGRSLGVEFEVYVEGITPVPQSQFKQWMNKLAVIYIQNNVPAAHAYHSNRSYNNWLLTFDRSIKPEGCGYEIVSPILAWDNEIPEVKKMLAISNQKIGTRCNSSCGLHVHIGLENLSLNDLKRITTNFLLFESAIDLFMPIERRENAEGMENPYCRSNLAAVIKNASIPYNSVSDYIRNSNSIRDLCQRLNPITDDSGTPEEIEHSRRYYRLNLTNVTTLRTIEFRQHEGTTVYFTTLYWIAFINDFIKLPALRVASQNPSDNLKYLIQQLKDINVVNNYIIPRANLFSRQNIQPQPVVIPLPVNPLSPDPIYPNPNPNPYPHPHPHPQPIFYPAPHNPSLPSNPAPLSGRQITMQSSASQVEILTPIL